MLNILLETDLRVNCLPKYIVLSKCVSAINPKKLTLSMMF